MENENSKSFEISQEDAFTIIRDITISFDAKGVYAIIKSYVDENIEIDKDMIMYECRNDLRGFRKGWRELKARGYLLQHQLQDENGKFYYSYELLQVPNKELADKIH